MAVAPDPVLDPDLAPAHLHHHHRTPRAQGPGPELALKLALTLGLGQAQGPGPELGLKLAHTQGLGQAQLLAETGMEGRDLARDTAEVRAEEAATAEEKDTGKVMAMARVAVMAEATKKMK